MRPLTVNLHLLFVFFQLNFNLLFTDNWVLKWSTKNSTKTETKKEKEEKDVNIGIVRGRILVCLIDFGRSKDTLKETYVNLAGTVGEAVDSNTATTANSGRCGKRVKDSVVFSDAVLNSGDSDERVCVDGGERKRDKGKERGGERGGVCDEYCAGVSHIITLIESQFESDSNLNSMSHTQSNASTQSKLEIKNQNNISQPHTKKEKKKKNTGSKTEKKTEFETDVKGKRKGEMEERFCVSDSIKNDSIRIEEGLWVESSHRVLFVGDTGARTFACNEMTNMVKLPLAVSQGLLPIKFKESLSTVRVNKNGDDNVDDDDDDNGVNIVNDEVEKIGERKNRRNAILHDTKIAPKKIMGECDQSKTVKNDLKMKGKIDDLKGSEGENVRRRGEKKCKEEMQSRGSDEMNEVGREKGVKKDEENDEKKNEEKNERSKKGEGGKKSTRDEEAKGKGKAKEVSTQGSEFEVNEEEEEGDELDRDALRKLTPWSYQVRHSH